MTAPVLAQSVPLIETVGSVREGRISPAWWRWLREIGAVITDLEGLSAISNGVLLSDQALVTGNNILTHGLGSVPGGWFAGNFVGAFGTSGSSSLLYPPIESFTRDVQWAQREASPTSRVIFTLGFTPTDGETLLAVFGIDNSSSSITSITQTGVTWEKVQRAYQDYANGSIELWIGHTISGASTTVQVDASAALPTPPIYVSMNCIQTDAISGTAARGSAGGRVGTIGTGQSSLDVSDYFTLPTPAAGDLVVSAWGVRLTSGDEIPSMEGWRMTNLAHTSALSSASTQVFHRTAQSTKEQSVLGRKTTTGAWAFIQAAFPTSLSAIGGSVTVPHGLRQVAADATTLTLESVSDVTADIWVSE